MNVTTRPGGSTAPMEVADLSIVDATPDGTQAFGLLIQDDDVVPAMDIPYYSERVIEGGDIGFRYRGRACLRTAKILPGDPTVSWLERHMFLTQLFVNLSDAPIVMVMAPPNHDSGASLPDIAEVRAFRFPGSSAFRLHAGTWHDFPLAGERPATLLIANSEEVVDTLQKAGSARELHEGDIEKVYLPDHFGLHLRPLL